MSITAEVFRMDAHNEPQPWARMSFEAAPQKDDEVLVGNESTKVVSARHVAAANNGGTLNMQYQVLVK